MDCLRFDVRIFRWIVVAVVVLLVATGGYVWYNYQHFVSGITHVDAISHSNAPAKDLDGADQNILLVGDDHRPAGATAQQLAELGTTADGGGTNTDTMMVLHVPADGRKATLISFPRDSWVNIPGFGMNKLNAAFAFGSENGGGDAGGARLLISTIQNLTGLTIDHFVRISMLGFYDVVKALGPVNVCLNNAVNDPYSTVNLPKGVSTLNAQQALAFVRQRHGLPNGDLDRIVRQQYFLSVEARQVLSAGTLLNPVKLQNVLDAVSSSIQTDPGLDLIALAAQLHGLSADNLSTATIPVSGTPTITVDGNDVSIVQVDTAAMPSFIHSVVGNPSAYVNAKAAAPSTVTVTVLNGSGADGRAASNTATLAALGFKTGTPGTTATTPTTTIEYASGMESAAKAVAAHVPGATVSATSSVSGVTLVLGADGVQATSASASTGGASGTSGSSGSPGSPAPAPTPSTPAKTYAQGACIN
ncbi:LCP family protein [Diaminobutyricibacter tongyongensis]|uniref:LCP family protein n=1 Tax=Leifsonia tongyongensis TaxID=1268043 RepID=A0A6L9XUC5_9MICO|nr:LCP family protein [Diaminobutyricibacter tongyongensis]NEN04877.1 LCP family protein [Diaminobutyricibacter tongyongensis]